MLALTGGSASGGAAMVPEGGDASLQFEGEAVAAGVATALQWAAHRIQGHRQYQEDCCVAEELPGLPGYFFFGVFDGHGGAMCSAAASSPDDRGILGHFLMEVQRQCNEGPPTDAAVGAALRGAILRFDRSEAVAYEREYAGVEGWPHSSGSTAVIAIITPTAYVVANVGDSRLALYRPAAAPPFATADHKPTDPAEKARVKRAGGRVMLGRVNGVLAMTRALGNFEQKNPDKPQEAQVISPCPDITVLPRAPSDAAMVLASDGVWDVMTVPDVGDYLLPRLDAAKAGDSPAVCSGLLRAALAHGSKDNLSAVVVCLNTHLPDGTAGENASDEAGGGAGPPTFDPTLVSWHGRVDAAATVLCTLAAEVDALRFRLSAIVEHAVTLSAP